MPASWGSGRVTVLDGEVRHQVDLDGAPAAGRIRQAVVVLLAVDELTDAPVHPPVRVTTSVAGLDGGGASGGVAGLVGVPARALPMLDAQAYAVDVTVTVAGFLPWTRSVPLPAQPGFPDTFTGVDLGRVPLHRRPVTLEVTTLALDPRNRPQPIGGAGLLISRVWRRFADLTGAGAIPRAIGVPLGIAQRWPAGTALDSVTLVPAAEPARRLRRGAATGEDLLSVDRLGTLGAGDVVGLDLAEPGRREYLPVAGISGSTEPVSPGDVRAGTPVRAPHVTSSAARRVPASPAAPPDATLTEAAESGDTTVFVDTVAPFATVEVLRASGGTIAVEYVDTHLFSATTDASGVGRIPALSRVAAVEITATRGALQARSRWTPDPLSPVNRIALTLR